MPVFKPNEYFWKHHWDGKEEKWVAFARAVRKCMQKTGGFEDTDLAMEDKIAYKILIRGKGKEKSM